VSLFLYPGDFVAPLVSPFLYPGDRRFHRGMAQRAPGSHVEG
jgi:hypothetical protein